ncbi:MAG: hypothetical protein ACOCP4_00780 [Candidatus Woesearchaeota archaeon]
MEDINNLKKEVNELLSVLEYSLKIWKNNYYPDPEDEEEMPENHPINLIRKVLKKHGYSDVYGDSDGLKQHPYHCPMCGENLYEISIGFLLCKKCNIQFLPTAKFNEEIKKFVYNMEWCSLEGY